MRLMVEFSIHNSSGDSSTPYLRAKGMVLRKVPLNFTWPLMASLWVAISPGARSKLPTPLMSVHFLMLLIGVSNHEPWSSLKLSVVAWDIRWIR